MGAKSFPAPHSSLSAVSLAVFLHRLKNNKRLEEASCKLIQIKLSRSLGMFQGGHNSNQLTTGISLARSAFNFILSLFLDHGTSHAGSCGKNVPVSKREVRYISLGTEGCGHCVAIGTLTFYSVVQHFYLEKIMLIVVCKYVTHSKYDRLGRTKQKQKPTTCETDKFSVTLYAKIGVLCQFLLCIYCAANLESVVK